MNVNYEYIYVNDMQLLASRHQQNLNFKSCQNNAKTLERKRYER